MNLGYLLVEGYEDVELIGGILKVKGLKRIIQYKDLFDYWSLSPIIPKSFPYKGDLTKRVPVPAFFQNDNFSIAIYCAEGDFTKMTQNFKSTLDNMPHLTEEMVGIGIVHDADTGATSTFKAIEASFNGLLQLPDTCGAISNGRPRTGVFLFPDNNNSGTMEKVLLGCAREMYTEILDQAQLYIYNIDQNVKGFDRTHFDKPAGKAKATLGCVSNVLKPGKAVQVSIQDNDWVCSRSIEKTELSKLNNFLADLLQLP